MMKFAILTFLALFASQAAIADDHMGATDEVLALVKQHWEARNENNFKAQLDLMSDGMHYHANSSGTFFYADEKPTLEAFQEDVGANEYDVEVFYPNAVMLSDTVVLARYYLEGTIDAGDTTVSNYRTRVSHIWVKEKGKWKSKSWHFSPLHNGGTVIR